MATTFECDGCAHHASYHSMENPAEDAILAKWSAAARSIESSAQSVNVLPSSKRRRIAQPQTSSIQVTDLTSDDGHGAAEALAASALTPRKVNA